MDIQLLRSKMALKGDSQAYLAKMLNIGTNTLSMKVNQKKDFRQSEIITIAQRYNLTADEIKLIFF